MMKEVTKTHEIEPYLALCLKPPAERIVERNKTKPGLTGLNKHPA